MSSRLRKSFPQISQIIADLTQLIFCDYLRNLREIILFSSNGLLRCGKLDLDSTLTLEKVKLL